MFYDRQKHTGKTLQKKKKRTDTVICAITSGLLCCKVLLMHTANGGQETMQMKGEEQGILV